MKVSISQFLRPSIGFIIPPIIAALYIPLPVSLINIVIMLGLSVLFSSLPRERTLPLLARSLIIVAQLIVVVSIICDAASYMIKGQPVNFYFWEIASLTTLRVYLEDFPHFLLLCGLAVFPPLYEAVVAFRRKWSCSLKSVLITIAVLSLVAATGASSPKHVIQSYFRYKKAGNYLNDLFRPSDTFIKRSEVKAHGGKNIVWIYIESFNKAMADESEFPGLMPYLNQAADNGILFQSLRQIPGRQSTMGGVLTTQCGRMTKNKITDDYDVCLGHILHTAGYNQVFIKGADLEFENFGLTFNSWKFDEILGKKEIEAAYPEYSKSNESWGYKDNVIFDLAYRKFSELSKKGKPFHLALLTVDTHEGDFDQDACSKHPYKGPGENNKVVQAFHCDDMLLHEFIRKISTSPAYNDTIIVIVGDHLMHQPLLHIKHYNDKIFGAILNTGKSVKINETTTHMDFAPTVLSLANIETNATFLDGNDLFGNNPAKRELNFAKLPDDIREELGLMNAPGLELAGIIYKHVAPDVYNYVLEHKIPFTEKTGIRAYVQERESFNWNNLMVVLESKDCLSLIGLPYLQFSDRQSRKLKIEFPIAEADVYRNDGACFRLISANIPRGEAVNTFEIGIERQQSPYWSMVLDTSKLHTH